jgi:acetyl esterase
MHPRTRTVADRLEGAVARLLARLPGGLAVRLSGEPAVVSEGRTLDPHVQLTRALRRRRAPFGLCAPDLERARLRYRRDTLVYQWPRTPVPRIRDLEIEGGARQVLRVRHYAPDADPGAPLTVYLHGGGFVLGDLETHDEPCRILCREGRVHVLAVDYRLAPEHPFPAGLEDALAALAWARANAGVLGADARAVGIGGDSAGGNLALVVALLTRGAGAPAAQLSLYPTVDSTTRRPSETLYGTGYFLSSEDRADCEGYYLSGAEAGVEDWRVSPGLCPDVSGLAPTLMVSAGFDMLRDEAEALGDRLEAAGSRVVRVREPAHAHGFIHMTGVSPDARRATAEVARAWGRLLRGSAAEAPPP